MGRAEQQLDGTGRQVHCGSTVVPPGGYEGRLPQAAATKITERIY